MQVIIENSSTTNVDNQCLCINKRQSMNEIIKTGFKRKRFAFFDICR